MIVPFSEVVRGRYRGSVYWRGERCGRGEGGGGAPEDKEAVVVMMKGVDEDFLRVPTFFFCVSVCEGDGIFFLTMFG